MPQIIALHGDFASPGMLKRDIGNVEPCDYGNGLLDSGGFGKALANTCKGDLDGWNGDNDDRTGYYR